MPLILAVHVGSFYRKEFNDKATGKPKDMTLLQFTVCNSYPDVTRDFYNSEMPCPKGVDPQSMMGWHWLVVPETTEFSFGTYKLKGLDLQRQVLHDFTSENVPIFEAALKMLQKVKQDASPPPPAYNMPVSPSSASHALPVTTRPATVSAVDKS